MKPFDLEKALAGEPVMLTSGEKAYIKAVVDNAWHAQSRDSFDKCLVGYIERSTNYIMCWHITGKAYHESINIKCMWEEPRPRVQLDLPCPLKEPQEEMWYIRDFTPIKLNYCERHKNVSQLTLENGLYFATKEDAQEWLDALRNARR